MKDLRTLKIVALIFVILPFTNHLEAQNLGIGTNKPRVKLHIVNGVEGVMGFPYETLVVEKSDDSKLGIYSTSSNPVNLKASSIALGYTNYLDINGNYPSYEMQYGVWDNAGFILRFNALSRSINGTYIPAKSYSNVLAMDAKGQVGINLTQGQAIAPISPTANLHVNGSVRFQNLPPATSGGNYLVLDASGNVKVSANSTANRTTVSAGSVNTVDEIELLKEEINKLLQRISVLEQAINNK